MSTDGPLSGAIPHLAALAANFACGGWVTWDRMTEDGVIADRYPLVASAERRVSATHATQCVGQRRNSHPLY
jgi:hypothetical protein